jgi:dethiobiotin synthetase
MSAFFITATGTDIGKTHVACGLIRHWRSAGLAVDALKPVATGFDMASAAQSDPGQLLAALGRPITPDEVARVSPWRFAAPLSPDMAARREGRGIDFAALTDVCRRAISDATASRLLIEGIGGVMVPFDALHTVLDLVAALRIPVVLVTGSYLGSISHTLTALDALERRGAAVGTLVVNETPASTVSLADTVETLANLAPNIPKVALERTPSPKDRLKPFSQIADLL